MLTPSTFDFSGIGTQTYLLYLATEFAMVVSPGAAVLFVMNRGVSQGFLASLAATAGVLTANAFLFVASGLGLSVLVLAHPLLFKALQIAGALYLLYLAWGTWNAKPGSLSLSHSDTRTHWQAFTTVLTLQLANPKAMLTFAAIVPPFINPAAPVAPQMAWLAAGSILPEFAVLALYGALAIAVRRWLDDAATLRVIERCCAVLLVCIAALVLWF